jgi:hypothetical protein
MAPENAHGGTNSLSAASYNVKVCARRSLADVDLHCCAAPGFSVVVQLHQRSFQMSNMNQNSDKNQGQGNQGQGKNPNQGGQQNQGNKPGQGGQQNQGQRDNSGGQQSNNDKSNPNRKDI